jgi:hypothetical protein
MKNAMEKALEIPDPAVGAAICAALRRQAERLGLSLGQEPVWREAVLGTETDPYSRQENRVAHWRGKARDGSVTFFADGRIFAEYQVLQAHPGRDDCYVESVQVWGRPDALKGDPVLREWGA